MSKWSDHVARCEHCASRLRAGEPIYFDRDGRCFVPQDGREVAKIAVEVGPPDRDLWDGFEDEDLTLAASIWVMWADTYECMVGHED